MMFSLLKSASILSAKAMKRDRLMIWRVTYKDRSSQEYPGDTPLEQLVYWIAHKKDVVKIEKVPF